MSIEVYGFLDKIPPTHRIPLVFTPVLLNTETGMLLLPPFGWHQGDRLVGWGATLEVENFEGTKVTREAAKAAYCLYSPPNCSITRYVTYAYAAEKIRLFSQQCMELGDDYLRAALQNYEDASAAAQAPEYYARMLLMPISRKRRERMQQCLADVATLDPPSLHVENVMEEIFNQRS